MAATLRRLQVHTALRIPRPRVRRLSRLSHAKPYLAVLPARQQKAFKRNNLIVAKHSAQAAAVATPSTDLIPKPVTSVLNDLTPFKGLPSVGEAHASCQPSFTECKNP